MANDTQIFFGLALYLVALVLLLTIIFGSGGSYNIGGGNLFYGSVDNFTYPISVNAYGIKTFTEPYSHYNVSTTRGLFLESVSNDAYLHSFASNHAEFGKVAYNINGTSAIYEKYLINGLDTNDTMQIFINRYSHFLAGTINDDYLFQLEGMGNGYTKFSIQKNGIISSNTHLMYYNTGVNFNFSYYYDYVNSRLYYYVDDTLIGSYVVKTYDFTTFTALGTYNKQVRPHKISFDNYDTSIISCYQTMNLNDIQISNVDVINTIVQVAIIDEDEDKIPRPVQILFINIPTLVLILIGVRLITGKGG